MIKEKKPSKEFSAFIKENQDIYLKFDELIYKSNFLESEAELNSINEKILAFQCLYLVYLIKKKSNSNEIQLKDIDKNSNLYLKMIEPLKETLQEIGFYLNEETIFDTNAATKYLKRIMQKGNYSPKPQGQSFKIKAMKKIFKLDSIKGSNIYQGETAIITKRPYMLNDCSKFKSGLYQFLMSNDIKFKSDMKLSNSNKNKDEREFYLMKKTGKNIEPLSIEHISLLIGLENVFMNCKEFIQDYGTLFLKKSDLLHLFGENFRGNREEIFLNLVRDLSQGIINVDIVRGSKNIETGEIVQNQVGQIEGNLISFSKMTNKEGDSIYKITMPFLQDLLKRSTRNSLKSIELLKYTFKQPKKVLIAEYLSNIIFYHRNIYGNKPKKISIKSILEQLGLYEEYKNMSAKDCNVYLDRLKKDIDVASHMIRNVKNIKFTPLSKSKIDDKSYGFTIYFKNENLEIED